MRLIRQLRHGILDPLLCYRTVLILLHRLVVIYRGDAPVINADGNTRHTAIPYGIDELATRGHARVLVTNAILDIKALMLQLVNDEVKE